MSGRFDSHPNIGSIIRIRDAILEELNFNHNYEQALSIMNALMSILKPEDQEVVLREQIENEYFMLADYKSISKRGARIRDRCRLYLDWNRGLNKILWDKDYLSNKKYDIPVKGKEPGS